MLKYTGDFDKLKDYGFEYWGNMNMPRYVKYITVGVYIEIYLEKDFDGNQIDDTVYLNSIEEYIKPRIFYVENTCNETFFLEYEYLIQYLIKDGLVEKVEE